MKSYFCIAAISLPALAVVFVFALAVISHFAPAHGGGIDGGPDFGPGLRALFEFAEAFFGIGIVLSVISLMRREPARSAAATCLILYSLPFVVVLMVLVANGIRAQFPLAH